MTQIKQMSLELQTLKQKTSQLEQEITQKTSEVSQMKVDLGSAKNKITQLENSNSGFGSVYTRWGRKDCPSNGTELVYTGVTGGGYYGNTGSAVNYVCLPHDPEFIQGDSPGGYATLNGSEYQTIISVIIYITMMCLCAVCRAITKSSVRLAAGADGHDAASEYVCVDHQAQYIEGGGADHNGKLFYKVGAKCGSLPCPPYFDMAPMSCVVCSK
ncbi:unnamed protein product [Mytilus coruscus]|uniref:Uncharacterized protein n=1 Tax=Mytilus coruscus TaxID=42192 RepID=A0A6J8DY08_MYTCO|nr:unnamed protein product [Mytilus coruscus]